MKKLLLWILVLAIAGFALYRFLPRQTREGAAARYREHEVSWAQVDRTRAMLSLLGEKGSRSDREIVDRILQGYILFDEAKALGVVISDSEVAAAVQNLPLPNGSQSAEDYLRSLSGSFEGSLDSLKQLLRGMLTQDRLREALERAACAERGIDFDPDHLPEEVSRAVNEKIDGLLEAHSGEIEYYF